MEQPITITNREEMIFMLSEAAQLEHMILCQYLFATFSLKRGTQEGLTATQLDTVTRWERIITAVAVQEMLHLTLVNNLLTAVGGAPYLDRPNFPQRAKYFPPGLQFALLPFGVDALRHFLYLERPEGMTREDAPEFTIEGAPVIVTPDDFLVPALEEFATVGHLYRGIEAGFRTLVERYGERRVFIGPARVQASTRYFRWPELITVTNLDSAIKAIETIVEEGEGARGDWSTAHYGKFLGVFQEYTAMKEQEPDFEPARPVVAGVVRPPADVDSAVPITDPVAYAVADLFNAAYEILLQVLNRFFVHSEETQAELHTLSDAAIRLMYGVLKPLGHHLTALPIGPELPGMTAGPSFEIYRTGYVLPHRDSAWIVLQERLHELANYCSPLLKMHRLPDELGSVETTLQSVADNLARHLEERTSHPVAPAAAAPTAAAQTSSAPSFDRDIRPLFRPIDIQSMAWAFDLGSYENVKSHAEHIYARLHAGTMPCDAPWPPDHVALFRAWIDGGLSP